MGKKENIEKWAKMEQQTFEDSLAKAARKEAEKALEPGAETSDIGEPKDAGKGNPSGVTQKVSEKTMIGERASKRGKR